MDSLGVARDLAADDAGGVGVVARPAHLSDQAVAESLYFQGAGGGAVVGTGAVTYLRLCGHLRISPEWLPGLTPNQRDDP